MAASSTESHKLWIPCSSNKYQSNWVPVRSSILHWFATESLPSGPETRHQIPASESIRIWSNKLQKQHIQREILSGTKHYWGKFLFTWSGPAQYIMHHDQCWVSHSASLGSIPCMNGPKAIKPNYDRRTHIIDKRDILGVPSLGDQGNLITGHHKISTT